MNARVLLAGGVVVVATVVLAVLLLSRGGSDDQPRVVRATLTLEQASPPGTGGRELVVSLPGPALNTLDVTGGERRVRLRCLDSAGAVAVVVWRGPALRGAGRVMHVGHAYLGPVVVSDTRRLRTRAVVARWVRIPHLARQDRPTRSS